MYKNLRKASQDYEYEQLGNGLVQSLESFVMN